MFHGADVVTDCKVVKFIQAHVPVSLEREVSTVCRIAVDLFLRFFPSKMHYLEALESPDVVLWTKT